MSLLARMILTTAVLVFLYCLAMLAILAHPYSWWGLLIVGFILLRRGRRRTFDLTGHGTAAWSSEESLRKLGWINAKCGMYIGLLAGVTRPTLRAGIRALFDGTLSAKEACRRFYLAFAFRSPPASLVRMPQPINFVCFAPSGVGKSTGFVIPFLMTTRESCVVLDYSGELAVGTSQARHRMGSEIDVLDPYGITTKKLPFKPAARNFLDGIRRDDPNAIDLCNALAQALVVRTGEEKDIHFLDMSEEFISTTTQVVVQYGRPGKRSLQEVADILANPAKLDTAIKLGQASPAWGGLLARNAAKLLNSVEKERSGTLTTCSRMLRWSSTPAMAAATSRSTFDPAHSKHRLKTTYLILPPEFVIAQAGWLRATINDLIMGVVRQGPDESRLVHFVLDESSSLGANLESLEGLVDKFRKYGCRTQWFYQSIGQLSKSWPKDNGINLLSNSVKLFAGSSEHETAKLVSSMLGNQTTVVESGGWGNSGGRNNSASTGAQSASQSQGSNSGWSSNENWQQISRELLKPDEIMTLSPRWAITFPGGGVRPIATYVVRYFENPKLFRPIGLFASFRAAFRSLLAAIVLLAVSLGLAVFLSQAATERLKAHTSQSHSARNYTEPIDTNYP